eukprot:4779274-Ditylum_brightwellii.AAC.1
MHIYRVHCQEKLNEDLLVGVVEVTTEDTSYFPNYGITIETANFEDLILRVVTHVISHGFKFIPANLQYNTSIRDGKKIF